jgi:hypothetical protein
MREREVDDGRYPPTWVVDVKLHLGTQTIERQVDPHPGLGSRLRPGIGELKRLTCLHDAAVVPAAQVQLQLGPPDQGGTQYRVEIRHRVWQCAVQQQVKGGTLAARDPDP